MRCELHCDLPVETPASYKDEKLQSSESRATKNTNDATPLLARIVRCEAATHVASALHGLRFSQRASYTGDSGDASRTSA
jgi:hypothetical protein